MAGGPPPTTRIRCLGHGHRSCQRLAGSIGVRYTRYADDLTFSGGHGLWRRAPDLTRLVTAIVAEEGFRVRADKTSRRAAGERQLVTGLVVNVRPNVDRREYDRLKAAVHHAAHTGGAGEDRDRLAGRIAWLEHVHPGHGAKVRARFDPIVWPVRPG